jgi:flagellar hook protein FlgE
MSSNMMYTAVSGLDTFKEAMSVVSNNIANSNTTGFKAQTSDFGDLVSGYLSTVYPNGTADGSGSAILATTADQSTGAEITTNVWSDCMIQGAGYFKVHNLSNTVDYYTRDGSFEVDKTGYLTDMNGNQVLDTADKAIQIPKTQTSTGNGYATYSIDQYGNVVGTTSVGGQDTLGTIGVTTFSNPNGMNSTGNNLLLAGPNAGTATVQAPGATTGQAGTLIAGALEQSNVDLTKQMVNLITYQADFQANSKSISTGNTLLQTVVNLIAG